MSDPNQLIPGPDPGACDHCGGWSKAGMVHDCEIERERLEAEVDRLTELIDGLIPRTGNTLRDDAQELTDEFLAVEAERDTLIAESKSDAEKIAHYDAMRIQNRKHHIWHGELQAEIKRLRFGIARALERTQVDDPGEATIILEQYVNLDGSPTDSPQEGTG